MLGAVYAILGGVAPLLVDDDTYMPRYVRMTHLVEVGISNFLFGLAVRKLVTPAHPAAARQRAAAHSLG